MPRTCAFHPETPFSALCLRCGAPLCAACRLAEGGYVYCPPCYRAAKLGEDAPLGGAVPAAPVRAGEARAEAPHACPSCGARWMQPYCPVCSLAFGAPAGAEPRDPPASSPAGDAAAPASPAEAAEKPAEAPSGFPRYLASSWSGAAFQPWEFFAQIPRGGGIAYPVAYLWTTALPPLVWSFLFSRGAWVDFLSRGALYVSLSAAAAVAAPFALAGSLCFYGLMMRGAVTFASAFRVVAYAASPLVLFGVPYLGTPLGLWAAALVVVGLERSGELSRGRALVAAASAFLTMWILRRLVLAGLAALAVAPENLDLFTR